MGLSFDHLEHPCCLIAEDTAEIQKYYSIVFEKMGLEHIIAKDGLEAIETIKAAKEKGFKFDLFVIDLIMPKIDGIQVLEEIRSMEEYKDTHILIVSAIHNQNATEKILKSFEPNSIYYKPIDTDKFLTEVKTLTEK